MGYSLSCRNCHQIFYLDRMSDEEKNYACPHCGASNWIDSSWHGLKEMNKEEFDAQVDKQIIDGTLSEKSVNQNRYPALKTISGFYNFCAILSIFIGVIGFIYGATLLDSYYSETQGMITMVASIIYGLIAYIISKAIAEGILLFIDIANDLNELKSNFVKDA